MIKIPGIKQTPKTANKVDVDQANTWLFSKTAEFEEANKNNDQQIQETVNIENYISEPSFNDGSNPNTITNQKKDFLEEVTKTTTPPNQVAQELWDNFYAPRKNLEISSAIARETAVVISGRKTTIDNTINLTSDQILQNPSSFKNKTIELKQVLHDENSVIPEKMRVSLLKEANEKYTNAYYKGMIRDNPQALLVELYSDKNWSKDQDKHKYAKQAVSSYNTIAAEDVDFLCNSLEKICQDISTGRKANTTPADYIKQHGLTDELVTKLATFLPWYASNMDPDTRQRTDAGESQLTVVSTDEEGKHFLHPSIIWHPDGKQVNKYGLRYDDLSKTRDGMTKAFEYYKKTGGLLYVESPKQGERISRHMSRLLAPEVRK